VTCTRLGEGHFSAPLGTFYKSCYIHPFQAFSIDLLDMARM